MTTSTTPPYWSESLDDAEVLLKHASETGVSVDATVRENVLNARVASETAWTAEIADKLLFSLATLANQLKPVTAESLRACNDATGQTVHRYTLIGGLLVLLIVPASCVSFVASDVTSSVKTDVTIANDLAVKLRAQLGAPNTARAQTNPADIRVSESTPPKVPAVAETSRSSDARGTTSETVTTTPVNGADSFVITELQQFAATVREIDGRANKLATYLFWYQDPDPFPSARSDAHKAQELFELPNGLPNLSLAAAKVTDTYQLVRYRAQNLGYTASLWVGAMTICILPILYALLGTCAYLARKFEDQLAARTFVPRGDDWIRFLVAAIAGMVVGLFGTFGQASVSPLALAFLVGYGVEAFFVFLDNMVQSFARGAAAKPPAKS